MSKALTKQFKWEQINRNIVLRLDDDHYISYNPNTGADHFGAMLDSLIGESGEETALVDATNPEHEYRILLGDWCSDYEKLAPLGFEACVDFFYTKAHKHGGQWSTHEIDRAKSNQTKG